MIKSMSKKKNKDILEVWLTLKNNKQKYEVRTFYNEKDRYVTVKIKDMTKEQAQNYIDTLKKEMYMYKIEVSRKNNI